MAMLGDLLSLGLLLPTAATTGAAEGNLGVAFAPETHGRIPNWLTFWVRDAEHQTGIFAEASWRHWRALQTVSEPPSGV